MSPPLPAPTTPTARPAPQPPSDTPTPPDGPQELHPLPALTSLIAKPCLSLIFSFFKRQISATTVNQKVFYELT